VLAPREGPGRRRVATMTMTVPTADPAAGSTEVSPATRRAEALAALACVLAGVALSMTPNLVRWLRAGDPAWVADTDELIYLRDACQAYFNHPTHLGDPVRADGGASISFWLPNVPPALAARMLGLRPVDVALLWHLAAGLALPAGAYLLVRHYVDRPA